MKTRRCCRPPPRRGAPRGSRPSWCRPASENSCESSPPRCVRRFLRRDSTSLCLIRNLLDNQQDPTSDGEDEDEFVPSKKELQSSSEEEAGGLDSDEEAVLKRGRRSAPGSKQKSRSLTRTPRKTPNKKVTRPRTSKPEPARCLFLTRPFLFPQIAAGTPRTPHRATPSIPGRSLPVRQPTNVLEEARAR